MQKRTVTLEEALTLAKLIKLDTASPSGISWRVRSGKGKANKREGEPAGTRTATGVYRVMVNGRLWYSTAAVEALRALSTVSGRGGYAD